LVRWHWSGRSYEGQGCDSGAIALWPRRRAAAASRVRVHARLAGCVVTAANAASQARPDGWADRTGTGLECPVATAGLPVAVAMAGGVQPRARGRVELMCLVCGHLFMALRVDRRTCSPACARRDRADRAAAKLERFGRACEECRRLFVAGRAGKRFCSSRCRVRAHRRRRPMTSIEDSFDVPAARLLGPQFRRR
jgi:hypothetical protein